jgi:hypothetical protein
MNTNRKQEKLDCTKGQTAGGENSHSLRGLQANMSIWVVLRKNSHALAQMEVSPQWLGSIKKIKLDRRRDS